MDDAADGCEQVRHRVCDVGVGETVDACGVWAGESGGQHRCVSICVFTVRDGRCAVGATEALERTGGNRSVDRVGRRITALRDSCSGCASDRMDQWTGGACISTDRGRRAAAVSRRGVHASQRTLAEPTCLSAHRDDRRGCDPSAEWRWRISAQGHQRSSFRRLQ